MSFSSSSQYHDSQFCLICINKCPLSGIRYSWSAMKEYFDGTMQHFRSSGRVFITINDRRIYLRKRYYQTEFNRKGFWTENANFFSWRVRYNGTFKKFKLKKCI